MKKIIFIDDEELGKKNAAQLQVDEFRAILRRDHNQEVEIETYRCVIPAQMENCLTNSGELNFVGEEAYAQAHQEIENVLGMIDQETDKIVAPTDRIEVVIDLCLCGGMGPESGVRLAKYLIKHMKKKEYFDDMRFVITLISQYLSTYRETCSKILDNGEMSKIETCYRPVIEDKGDSNKLKLDKEGTAFPKYYYKYRMVKNCHSQQINRLLRDSENGPADNVGTFYGNFFGLIYARLYYGADGEEE